MRSGVRFTFAAVLMMTALSAVDLAAHSPKIRLFIRYYDTVQNTNAPMSLWERVAYSLVLTNAGRPEGRPAKSNCKS
jgi:hypothetical protein